MAKIKPLSVEKIVPVLLFASIALAFLVGVLWQKVQGLETGSKTTTAPTTTNTTTNTQQAPAGGQTSVTMDQIKDVFGKDVIKFGDANRKLLLVEIADPSCPYCHVAAGKDPELNNQIGAQFKLTTDGGQYQAPVPEFKKLVDAGKASFAYIYFPGHGNGEMGTKALYCANELGRFWEAHDLLMSNAGYNLLNNDVKNDKTKSQTLADFLGKVVDSGKLKSCLDSGKYDNTLNDDVALATSLGVQGTPGFYINTTVFPGAYSFKDMQSAVDAALK